MLSRLTYREAQLAALVWKIVRMILQLTTSSIAWSADLLAVLLGDCLHPRHPEGASVTNSRTRPVMPNPKLSPRSQRLSKLVFEPVIEESRGSAETTSGSANDDIARPRIVDRERTSAWLGWLRLTSFAKHCNTRRRTIVTKSRNCIEGNRRWEMSSV